MNADEAELRTYDCDACGAKPGNPCTIMRRRWGPRNTFGKPTAAHNSRHEKRRRAKQGGRWVPRWVPDGKKEQ